MICIDASIILHSIQDLLNKKSCININLIKLSLKSLKQYCNIFAYTWVYYVDLRIVLFCEHNFPCGVNMQCINLNMV